MSAYMGSGPLFGTHRYYFTLCVLDAHLPADFRMTRRTPMRAMDGPPRLFAMNGWFAEVSEDMQANPSQAFPASSDTPELSDSYPAIVPFSG